MREPWTRRPLLNRTRQLMFTIANTLTIITALACQVPIESRLSEEQANRILVSLNEASIDANKVPEGHDSHNPRFRVEVASSKVGRALAVLQKAELPKRPEPGWDEIYGKSSIIPTVAEESARLSAALSGELSRTIESMPGIIDARVHIAIPNNRATPLDTTAVRPRASVVVKAKRDASKRQRHERETAIRRLVAGAVQNMESEDVSVIEVAATARVRAAPVLVEIGPITVTRDTVGALRLIASALLVSLFILAIVVIVLFTRLRHLSQKVKHANP